VQFVNICNHFTNTKQRDKYGINVQETTIHKTCYDVLLHNLKHSDCRSLQQWVTAHAVRQSINGPRLIKRKCDLINTRSRNAQTEDSNAILGFQTNLYTSVSSRARRFLKSLALLLSYWSVK
jgi:hypothetical protein